MQVSFLGACRTTTGSQYLLQVNGSTILLECGLYQGKRDESQKINENFPFDPKKVDCCVISHAHLDHCGNLPNLVKQGFSGNIYCTSATRDLLALMLEDSAHIQESDAEFVSRQRAKKKLPPVKPLYTAEDVRPAIQQCVSIGYHRKLQIAPGVELSFRDAGHILGSAQVVLDIQETGAKRLRYLFSGDVGRGNDLILRDPEVVADVDFLQIESTYGTREHDDKTQAQESTLQEIISGIQRGAKIIVPAFALGRTQQVVYSLNKLIRDKKFPQIPIYVDSPLATNATEIHRIHPECFNEQTYNFFNDIANPFEISNLRYIRDVQDSKELNDKPGPMMIISSSGMAEGGRVRHHLKNNLSDPNNIILFVGYCAQETLGGKIRQGMSPVNIFGDPVDVRAKVLTLDAYSGHADRSELIDYVSRISGKKSQIFVVHGEEQSAIGFAQELAKLYPESKTLAPTKGTKVDL